MVTKLQMWSGGKNQDVGIHMYITQYIKYINNQNLLHGTRNSTQYSVITYMEKQSEGIPWRVEWLGLGASTVGSIPARGTKILQAAQGGQKKEKQSETKQMYIYV